MCVLSQLKRPLKSVAWFAFDTYFGKSNLNVSNIVLPLFGEPEMLKFKFHFVSELLFFLYQAD